MISFGKLALWIELNWFSRCLIDEPHVVKIALRVMCSVERDIVQNIDMEKVTDRFASCDVSNKRIRLDLRHIHHTLRLELEYMYIWVEIVESTYYIYVIAIVVLQALD